MIKSLLIFSILLISNNLRAAAAEGVEVFDQDSRVTKGNSVFLCLHGKTNVIIAKKVSKGYWFKKEGTIRRHPKTPVCEKTHEGVSYYVYPEGFYFPNIKAPGEWCLPGGGSKGGRLEEEALREFREETGYNLILKETDVMGKKFTTTAGVTFYALYVDVSKLLDEDPRVKLISEINNKLTKKQEHIDALIDHYKINGNLEGFLFAPPVMDDELEKIDGNLFSDVKTIFDGDESRRGWYSRIIAELI